MKKSALRAAILHELGQELSRQTNAAQLSREEAISEESRAENKWDTHSQEAAYLAEGQAKLALEIGASIELYGTLPLPDFSADGTIALGALVGLGPAAAANPGKLTWYFLGPRAGGITVVVDGREIQVVTPQSPLGRQLLGRRVGDSVSSPGRGAATLQRIVALE